MKAALALAALLLSACATPASRVILLAGPDGKLGKVAVLQQGGETVLATANSSASISRNGKVQTGKASAEDLAGFDAVRGALPARPVSFTLYFEENSDQITVASGVQMPSILREVAARPAVEVVIIGHTDRVGGEEYNDKLSLARALVVREQLLTKSMVAGQLRAEGRGEREPLVATPDEMPEPRNRRVEISVR